MMRALRLFALAALGLAAGLGPVVGLSGTAVAKSYDFPLVAIDARVAPDGSMLVTERRTYSFSGDFSWATYTLERRGWTAITEVGVADARGPYAPGTDVPRTFRVSRGAGEVEIRWFFRAADEDVTFAIHYRLEGVVTRYRDTAELYWRFVGTGWDVPTRQVRITVAIPGAAEQDLRAWGHGPLTGTTTIGDGRVDLAADDLAPGEFVEARILFPGRLVPGVRLTDEEALPRILAEEARWARGANLNRAVPMLNLLMLPGALVGAVVVWGALYLSAGREHRVRIAEPYLRDLPERYPPAILGALLRWGRPGRQDFAATILDLARRGFLTITQEGGDRPAYRFTRTAQPDDPLPASERQALRLLFARAPDRTSITEARLWSEAWKHPDVGRRFRAWQEAVAEEARRFGFFDRHSERVQHATIHAYWLFALLGVAITVVGLVWLRIPVITSMVAFPIFGFLITLLRGPIARRTLDGATDLARWRAFRRFLADFSMLRDAPPPAVAVWEHYLPYAVTLGVAEKVIRQLPVVYGEETARRFQPSWYIGARAATGAGGRGWDALSAVSSVSRTLSRSMAVAASPRSSSSGRSGGFSSGSRSSGGSRGGGGSGGRAG